MWIPRWLGECYSKLYVEFGLELFTFKDALKVLGLSRNRLSVAFSKLHSKRFLLIFKRSRPRLYRLLSPENIILLASGRVKNFHKISQERYLNLILRCLAIFMKVLRLNSFAVYGSVARGTASEGSDVDVLVISDDFHGSLASRIDKLYQVEEALKNELSWLRRHGVLTMISFYPLRPDEARRIPILFLDLTDEAVILYDENRFLETLLLEFKAKLLAKGAKRVSIDKRRWYWDLNPSYKFGEKIEIG